MANINHLTMNHESRKCLGPTDMNLYFYPLFNDLWSESSNANSIMVVLSFNT